MANDCPAQNGRTNLRWGAKSIGEELNTSTRKAFHLLERGHVPGAQKIGGSWVLNVDLFHASFSRPSEVA